MKRKSLGYKKLLFPFVPGEFEHFGNIKCRGKEAGMGHWKVENREKYVEGRQSKRGREVTGKQQGTHTTCKTSA